MEIQHYFFKLTPPRPSFVMDMTEDEKNIMQQHQMYWQPYVDGGTIIVFGPVLDPAGPYGAGVIKVKDENELKDLLAGDPANGLSTYTYYPMMATYKKG